MKARHPRPLNGYLKNSGINNDHILQYTKSTQSQRNSLKNEKYPSKVNEIFLYKTLNLGLFVSTAPFFGSTVSLY